MFPSLVSETLTAMKIEKKFKVFRTFSPDHKNVIDVSQPSMGLKWGVP